MMPFPHKSCDLECGILISVITNINFFSNGVIAILFEKTLPLSASLVQDSSKFLLFSENQERIQLITIAYNVKIYGILAKLIIIPKLKLASS